MHHGVASSVLNQPYGIRFETIPVRILYIQVVHVAKVSLTNVSLRSSFLRLVVPSFYTLLRNRKDTKKHDTKMGKVIRVIHSAIEAFGWSAMHEQNISRAIGHEDQI